MATPGTIATASVAEAPPSTRGDRRRVAAARTDARLQTAWARVRDLEAQLESLKQLGQTAVECRASRTYRVDHKQLELALDGSAATRFLRLRLDPTRLVATSAVATRTLLSVDTRVAARLEALEPCLVAQELAATATGTSPHSARGLVDAHTQLRANSARHAAFGMNFASLSAPALRRLQRGSAGGNAATTRRENVGSDTSQGREGSDSFTPPAACCARDAGHSGALLAVDGAASALAGSVEAAGHLLFPDAVPARDDCKQQ